MKSNYCDGRMTKAYHIAARIRPLAGKITVADVDRHRSFLAVACPDRKNVYDYESKVARYRDTPCEISEYIQLRIGTTLVVCAASVGLAQRG